jgi:hypothetical protein
MADPFFPPRLLPAAEAAHYLGVSETTLRNLSLPRRMLGAKRLYDRLTLDEYASSLPVEGEDGGRETDEVDECDRHFGLHR